MTIFSLVSEVLTPRSDPAKWLLTKTIVLHVHQDVCHGKYHLGQTHFVDTIYCLLYPRHFSKQHPLYEFMMHHCEGTTSHISLAYANLVFPNSIVDQVFSIGFSGYGGLAQKAYAERHYGLFDFEVMMKVCNTFPLIGYTALRSQNEVFMNLFIPTVPRAVMCQLGRQTCSHSIKLCRLRSLMLSHI